MVFVGAVESSAVALESLMEAGMPPALVVTLPPSAATRHSDFADLTAIARGLPVHHTTNINSSETAEASRAVKPDICLVVGWSQICGPGFRSIAASGTVGFHPSPLPRMRGRAVIPWTILLGEQTSASSLFWLDEGVDSGDILLQFPFEVSPSETARSLYDKHLRNIGAMVPEAINLIRSGVPPRLRQDHALATYCAKRTPSDGLIDWNQSAETVLRLIRAVGDPYPGALTYLGNSAVNIDAARLEDNPGRYIGLPGQVQAIDGCAFTVRCGDGNCIVVTRWRNPGGAKLMLHSRLGNGGEAAKR